MTEHTINLADLPYTIPAHPRTLTERARRWIAFRLYVLADAVSPSDVPEHHVTLVSYGWRFRVRPEYDTTIEMRGSSFVVTPHE